MHPRRNLSLLYFSFSLGLRAKEMSSLIIRDVLAASGEIKDDDVDLNPLIDVITLLIVFFILGGKMSSDIRTEQQGDER